jgi:hypothetical protein
MLGLLLERLGQHVIALAHPGAHEGLHAVEGLHELLLSPLLLRREGRS